MILFLLLACSTSGVETRDPAAAVLDWRTERLSQCVDRYTSWALPDDGDPLAVNIRRVHESGAVSYITNVTTDQNAVMLIDCEGEGDEITVTYAVEYAD